MRNINVNQAVTNPQPVALPLVLGKGVAQQDAESYKPTGERLSFLLGGSLWYASHRNEPRSATVFIPAFFTNKMAYLCAKFLSQNCILTLTKPGHRAYNRVNKEMRNTHREEKKNVRDHFQHRRSPCLLP